MIKALFLLFAISTPILSLYSYPDCKGTPNNLPLITDEPKFVAAVPNGKKYIINSTNNGTHITILALKGSWYDMGYAYGSLLKDDLHDAANGMYDYLVERAQGLLILLKDFLPFFLKWIPDLLKLAPKQLLDALLALTHQFTAPYTHARYDQQFRGMSDASGLDFTFLRNLNLFPELIRAQCSMIGAWGPASADGNLVQLRALDWQADSYIVNFPLAVVYFPDEPGSNPFATFGFTSVVGAISGYSNKIAISEKVWIPTTSDPQSWFGVPFLYILKDLLQFGNDLQSSVDQAYNTPRTCRVHIGIGSRADNCFEGIQMSFNEFNIFDDKNYTHYSEAHPQMDGVMFWDQRVQPSNDKCMGAVLQDKHGNIDAEVIYREIVPLHKTGDTQIAVYDFAREFVYLAYSDPKTNTMAYDRPLMRLNMKEIMNYNNHFKN